ncbi:MAG: transposase, partial [Clostridia bacterium]
AAEEYEILTGDEYERRLAYLRDKAIRDEKSAIESAKDLGRQEGKTKVAQKLLELGYKIEEIQKITELSKEEIEKLKDKM